VSEKNSVQDSSIKSPRMSEHPLEQPDSLNPVDMINISNSF